MAEVNMELPYNLISSGETKSRKNDVAFPAVDLTGGTGGEEAAGIESAEEEGWEGGGSHPLGLAYAT